VHIDGWTIALQATNFLLLAWLLQHFLYRPVLAVIERRREATDRVLAEAEAAKSQAEEERQQIAARLARIDGERELALAESRKAAAVERDALIATARGEAERARDEARRAIERERSEALRQLSQAATRLAAAIARRLLSDLPPPATEPFFIERACAGIAALPPERRQALARGELAVVSAAPLGDAARERLRCRLEALLAAPPDLRFEVDATLVGGLDLHAGTTILRCSWADDLARIAAEADTAEHARA